MSIPNSTGNDDWGTPPEVYRWIHENVGTIKMDAAPQFRTETVYGAAVQDGLAKWRVRPNDDGTPMLLDQNGIGYCNPPYSRAAGGLEAWTRSMYRNSHSVTVVGLFFARTETKAWHNWVSKAAGVWFIKGRLRFIDPATGERGGTAPAPSVLVVWRPGHHGPPTYRNLDLDPWR
jgi:hypothetical protein